MFVSIRGAVLEALRSKVEATSKKQLRVGIVKTHTYANRESYYGGPLTVAEVAKYYEYGWVQRVTGKQSAYLNSVLALVGAGGMRPGATLAQPPRPFMRGTFAEKHESWSRTAASVFAQTLDAQKALELTGLVASQDVRMSLLNASANGQAFQLRSPLTMALLEASTMGHRTDETPSNSRTDKPGQDTGTLAHSISYEVT